MNSRNRATLIGFVAIVLWSSVVGLIRGVSDSFGATGGAAMIYTGAAALLLVTTGLPRLGDFPRRYLLWGSVLFVAYEWCLSLSIGNAHTARQAIEVGVGHVAGRQARLQAVRGIEAPHHHHPVDHRP